MKLPAGYYAFASPSELSAKKPNALRRLGMDWVVWQGEQGQWVAQSDRCPHRSARLSGGRVKNGQLECPFHGFCFDTTGTCTHVPELKRDAPGLKLRTTPLTLKYDFLWLPWQLEGNAQIPWFDELENPEFTYCCVKKNWKTHFSRCVENQLDYAHLPFVHSNSIGRGFDPSRKVTWDIQEKGIRVYLGENAPKTGFFEFHYPNVWQLHISNKMVQTLMFVPVDEQNTLIYARAYHRYTQIPVLRELIAWVSAHLANPYILAQDEKVVLTQEPRDVRDCTDEHLFPSDRAILTFRKWLADA